MSGNSVKLEVLWSPVHHDKFITWGTDISLYETAPLKEISKKHSCIKLSETVGANLVASNGNYHYVKCVDIYRCKNEPDLLLAIGQANGKVVLTTFGPTAFDANGLNGKELVPRHARQCNAVAWNHTDTNIIGAALDKYRNDHCILLWDVLRSGSSGDGSASPRVFGPSSNNFASQQYSNNAASAIELARPIAEMGLSETAHSMAWPAGQPRTLVVGMNQKQIKLFDLRDFSNKAVTVAPTKAVYDVCLDPFNDNQLASHVDNLICIWDTRNFDKPILSLLQNRAVTKILWCPTRRNLLGSLQRDSCLLRMHDVQHTPADTNGVGVEMTAPVAPAALERSVAPGSPHTITGFSWHSVQQCRLLTVSLSGVVTDYTVSERITLNWGAGHIVWSRGHRTLNTLDENFFREIDDISVKIKHRAMTDYGLKSELWQNGDLAEDDQLKKLWHWLYLSKTLVEDGLIKSSTNKHPGVKSVLKLDPNNGSANGSTPGSSKSETVISSWIDFPTMHTNTYRSEERDKALQLCGWPSRSEAGIENIGRLEGERGHTRAAAIAVFHLKLGHAIDILNKGAEKLAHASHLNIIAMALAGYTDERSTLWKQMCSNAKAQLTDPYIRAIFAFLTAENNVYDGVLNESGISVEDKIAFACTFLSDSKLAEFVKNYTAKLIADGNLAGILLTGAGPDGVSLIQRYVDCTGDVQTAALIAARAFQTDLMEDQRVIDWIQNYRWLLDSRRYWWERARYDVVFHASTNPAPNNHQPLCKPTQQVYVSCNYCGKSISTYPQGLTGGRGTFPRIAATSSKLKQISACPNCRKPLPRCAVCLLHMGTPAGAPMGPMGAMGALGPLGPGKGKGGGALGPTPPPPPPLPLPQPPASAPNSLCPSSSTATTLTGSVPKAGDFARWFTWCQTCRHGGHAGHIMQWFNEHLECPVTSCACRCQSLDSITSHASPQV